MTIENMNIFASRIHQAVSNLNIPADHLHDPYRFPQFSPTDRAVVTKYKLEATVRYKPNAAESFYNRPKYSTIHG